MVTQECFDEKKAEYLARYERARNNKETQGEGYYLGRLDEIAYVLTHVFGMTRKELQEFERDI